MKRLTAFSFGYWGWGNSTEQLVQAADAVERSRGFKPPIFVDVRISRSVRAVGFSGHAFGDLLGPKRYHWMKRLGNERILTANRQGMTIADPSAAEDLLDLAMDAAHDNRRVIFFCGCANAKTDGKVTCHRVRVATLVRAAAKRRGLNFETVEWPGGKPQHFQLSVSDDIFRSVIRGRTSIPIGQTRQLAEWASVPWGSVVTLESSGQQLHRIVGPAKWEKQEWALPVFYWCGVADYLTGISG